MRGNLLLRLQRLDAATALACQTLRRPVYFKIKNLEDSIFRSTRFTFEIWLEIACDREKGNLGILAKAVVE